jgi:hypothetical protein
MGLKDEFLKAAEVPYREMDVNGVTVRVRAFTAQMQLDVEAVASREAGDITFWVLENCLLDPETGERLFDDDDPAVRELDGNAIIDLANAAIELTSAGNTVKN